MFRRSNLRSKRTLLVDYKQVPSQDQVHLDRDALDSVYRRGMSPAYINALGGVLIAFGEDSRSGIGSLFC